MVILSVFLSYVGKKKNLAKFKKKFRKLLSEAELSGVSTIVNSRGYGRKIAKLVIVICGLTGFCYQTSQFLDIYWRYLVITTVSQLEKLEKPAITICDKNRLSGNYICKQTKVRCRISYYPGREFGAYDCEKKVSAKCVPPDANSSQGILYSFFHEIEDYYNGEFTKEAGFNIQSNLLQCQWRDRKMKNTAEVTASNCSQPTFVRGMTKDKYPAACYTINSAIANSNYAVDYLYENSHLAIILKWDYLDLMYSTALTAIEPLRSYLISIHSPGKFSNPYIDGFKIEQGKHYHILVSQVDEVRLPSPYSSQCFDYIGAWRQNHGQGPLDKEDCERTCEIQESFAKYDCDRQYVTYPHDKPLCRDVRRNDFILMDAIKRCVKKCRDACQETKYVTNVYVENELDLNYIYQKYKTPLVVTIEVRFDLSNSTKISEMPVYQTVEMFSHIGGYMGIWLGWSLAAILELVEIFFYAIINYLSL